jgi:hypothetical protein
MPSNETPDERAKSNAVLKSGTSGLEPLQKDQKRNSVYDFLYHDVRRIASFLAQFETYGVLQQVKAIEAASRTESTKSGLTTNLSAAIAKAGIGKDITTGSEERDSAERIYDPFWANARILLNYLAERDMIIRDIIEARIGQFVLVTGNLAAFDLSLLKETWQLPIVKDTVFAAAAKDAAKSATLPPPKNKAERAKDRYAKQALPEGMEAGFELMKILPHTIQASISGSKWSVWSSLREDSLVMTGSELLLKHGIWIEGAWNMLGILDALPHGGEDQLRLHQAQQMVSGASLGGFLGQVITPLAPAARMMLGRPATSFGMTPLLIFREVSG